MPNYTRKESTQPNESSVSQSQSSNYDGNEEAMDILLKAQATVAKNKKQRQSQHLKDTKKELGQLLEAGARDYAMLIGELEELCREFQMELAASYDREGKLWADAAAEQTRFKDSISVMIKVCQSEDEEREKAHIEALGLAHSSLSQSKSIVSKHMS